MSHVHGIVESDGWAYEIPAAAVATAVEATFLDGIDSAAPVMAAYSVEIPVVAVYAAATPVAATAIPAAAAIAKAESVLGKRKYTELLSKGIRITNAKRGSAKKPWWARLKLPNELLGNVGRFKTVQDASAAALKVLENTKPWLDAKAAKRIKRAAKKAGHAVVSLPLALPLPLPLPLPLLLPPLLLPPPLPLPLPPPLPLPLPPPLPLPLPGTTV